MSPSAGKPDITIRGVYTLRIVFVPVNTPVTFGTGVRDTPAIIITSPALKIAGVSLVRFTTVFEGKLKR
jgi:hypothetical protein